jgi:hypothetical protein
MAFGRLYKYRKGVSFQTLSEFEVLSQGPRPSGRYSKFWKSLKA